MKRDKKRYCVILDTDLHKKLQGVSTYQNRSMSNVITHALDLYFKENFKK